MKKEKYEGLYCEVFCLPDCMSVLTGLSIDVDEFEPIEDGGEA